MKNVFIFITGVAIGSVITWKLVEKKYKELADEEINSVIETFKNRKGATVVIEEPPKEEITTDNIVSKTQPIHEVEKIIKSNEYSSEITKNEDDHDCFVDVETGIEVIVPYVIQPEQYLEFEEYGGVTLTYYTDDILADENDTPITEDRDILLGPDALSHFGEYEDDCIYIRDETNEIDYEILRSDKQFSEIPRGRAN